MGVDGFHLMLTERRKQKTFVTLSSSCLSPRPELAFLPMEESQEELLTTLGRLPDNLLL